MIFLPLLGVMVALKHIKKEHIQLSRRVLIEFNEVTYYCSPLVKWQRGIHFLKHCNCKQICNNLFHILQNDTSQLDVSYYKLKLIELVINCRLRTYYMKT